MKSDDEKEDGNHRQHQVDVKQTTSQARPNLRLFSITTLKGRVSHAAEDLQMHKATEG